MTTTKTKFYTTQAERHSLGETISMMVSLLEMSAQDIGNWHAGITMRWPHLYRVAGQDITPAMMHTNVLNALRQESAKLMGNFKEAGNG